MNISQTKRVLFFSIAILLGAMMSVSSHYLFHYTAFGFLGVVFIWFPLAGLLPSFVVRKPIDVLFVGITISVLYFISDILHSIVWVQSLLRTLLWIDIESSLNGVLFIMIGVFLGFFVRIAYKLWKRKMNQGNNW